jgi:hypothetical protein
LIYWHIRICCRSPDSFAIKLFVDFSTRFIEHNFIFIDHGTIFCQCHEFNTIQVNSPFLNRLSDFLNCCDTFRQLLDVNFAFCIGNSTIYIATSADFMITNSPTPIPSNNPGTISAPSLAPIADSLPPTGKTYLVRMSISLPITLAQFNSSAQLLLRRQIAITAGLPAETGWAHVNITVQSLRQRRLLQSGVSVAVTITMPSLAAANAASSALSTPDRLNAALASVGLPPAQITSAPTVTAVSDSPTPPALSGARRRGATGRLASVAVLTAAALAAGAAGRGPAW